MPKKQKRSRKTSKELQYMGKCIKTKRNQCGLTQGELAEQTGRGLRHIQNIEGGLINPSYEVVSGIVRRLAMSSDCMIYENLPEVEQETKQLLCKFAACTAEERQFLLNTMDFMVERFLQHRNGESNGEKT